MIIRRYEAKYQEAIVSLHVTALQDVGALLERGSWDEDLDSVEASYLSTGGEFLVGHVSDLLVAMGGIRRIDQTTAEIKRMRVLPSYQGRGFGGALLLALEVRAAELGYRHLVLDTTARQVVAQSLYRSRGYIETRRKQFRDFELIYFEKTLA